MLPLAMRGTGQRARCSQDWLTSEPCSEQPCWKNRAKTLRTKRTWNLETNGVKSIAQKAFHGAWVLEESGCPQEPPQELPETQ